MTSTVTGYMSNYSTTVLGISAVYAAYIGQFQAYFSPLGAIGGGIVADKLGVSKMLLIGAIGMVITVLTIGYMPKGAMVVIAFLVLYAFFNVFLGVSRGLYYATMKESDLPMYLSGTAIGIMATIGYTPDIFLSPYIGRILDMMAPEAAYRYIFTILAGFGVFCAIMILVFRHMNKDRIKLLDEEMKEKRLNKKIMSNES